MRIAILLANALICAALGFSALASAGDVRVENAWTRATLPGQKVAGGFMNLTASKDMELVGASSPASELVELHFMRMHDGGMEMRELPSIALPKGKTVQLEPGGMHAMLIDLRSPLKSGEQVPMTLTFSDSKGAKTTLDIKLMVVERRH